MSFALVPKTRRTVCTVTLARSAMSSRRTSPTRRHQTSATAASRMELRVASADAALARMT